MRMSKSQITELEREDEKPFFKKKFLALLKKYYVLRGGPAIQNRKEEQDK